MPSPSDSQELSTRPNIGGKSGDAQTTVSSEYIDLNQVYILVDSILPFEACLYYQVIPLFIEGSRLVIGIVNLNDYAASEYVKKQLSYINYSITFKEIQLEWHRELLSKYLSHHSNTQQQTPQEATSSIQSSEPSLNNQTATSKNSQSNDLPRNTAPQMDDRSLQTTFIVDQPDEILDQPTSAVDASNSQTTFVIDSLDKTANSDKSHTKPLNDPRSHIDKSEKKVSSGSDKSHTKPSRDSKVHVNKSEEKRSPMKVGASPPDSKAKVAGKVSSTSAPLPSAPPLHLQIGQSYQKVKETQLAKLPPKLLMQALLGRVLEEGIGRLYFERQTHSGRILWSRDGILQAVVESIDPHVFQGVINEFKLLTHLSLIAAKKPRQVEIERLYENQRILLRFRVMPNTNGEEATLQVLRGTALKFYQQQQIDKLGRDALDTAQKLQHRLNEIRARARHTLNFKPIRSETLPAIVQLLKQMEAQVQEIVSTYDREEVQISQENEADF